MSKSINRETYLAKWISGEFNNAELKNYVSEDEFNSYILLKEIISDMQSISPDIEANFSKLKYKKQLSLSPKPKLVKLKRVIYSSVAVLFLFLTITSYHFGYFGEKNVSTKAQSKEISIGKNVSLFIYQNTSITQDAPLYNVEEVRLDYGEVYFEVIKGQKFTIKTANGYVQVLGTKFKVKSINNTLEVKCFEGKVKVNYLGLNYFVNSGNEFNSYDSSVKILNENNSLITKKGLSYQKFYSVNLIDIKTFLEKNYEIKVIFPKRILNQKFTGTLPKKELELSLGLIASSFHLSYEVKNGYVIFKE